jgi:Ca2+-binding EF-hand superfamily protein
LKEAFHYFDYDIDGNISKDDLVKVMTEYRFEFKRSYEHEAESLIKKANLSQNHLISYSGKSLIRMLMPVHRVYGRKYGLERSINI